MTLSLLFTKLFLGLKGRFNDAAGERGATAVEYALVVGALAIVIATAVGLLGGRITTKFGDILK